MESECFWRPRLSKTGRNMYESRGDSRLWGGGQLWVLRQMNKYEKLKLSVQVNHKNGSSCILPPYLVMFLFCHHLAFSSGGSQHCQVPWSLYLFANNPQGWAQSHSPLCMSTNNLYSHHYIWYRNNLPRSCQPPDICSCFQKLLWPVSHSVVKSFQIFYLLLCIISQILPLKCPNMFLNLEDLLLVFKKETCKVSYQGTFSAVKLYLPTPCGQRSIRYIPDIFVNSSVVAELLLQSLSCRQ